MRTAPEFALTGYQRSLNDLDCLSSTLSQYFQKTLPSQSACGVPPEQLREQQNKHICFKNRGFSPNSGPQPDSSLGLLSFPTPLGVQIPSLRLFQKFNGATSFPLKFAISKRRLARRDSNGDTRAALFSHFAQIKSGRSPQLFITTIKEGIRVSKQNEASRR